MVGVVTYRFWVGFFYSSSSADRDQAGPSGVLSFRRQGSHRRRSASARHARRPQQHGRLDADPAQAASDESRA